MTAYGRFIAFYSHKGGVGRSLVLANIAYELARQKKKVLVVDLDLEAPGQHMTDLFRPRVDTARDLAGWPGKGLLELLTQWRDKGDKEAFDFDLMDFLRPAKHEVGEKLKGQGGELWLLPTGDVSAGDYDERISQFSWKDFYASGGQALLHNLRHRFLAEGFDHVLIDARTGISDELYISALELADTVVVVSSLNWQNIEGTRRVVDTLLGSEVEKVFGRKRVLLVASPVPTMIGAEALTRRRANIRMQWPRFQGFHAELPYDPDLALEERVFCWERDNGAESKLYVAVIDKLLPILLTDIDTYRLLHAQNKLKNPFSLIRRDYIADEDIVRFFVDPGGNIVEGMRSFTPLVVTGSRGSGKTMLACKFSLDVVLAEQRRLYGRVNLDEIEQVGLYLRIDADFLDSFNQLDEAIRETFSRLFAQFFDIVVIRKALLALESLGGIGEWCDEAKLIQSLSAEFAEKAIEPTHTAFADFLEEQLVGIRLYLNNPHRVECPILISPNSLMKRLMEALHRDGRIGRRYFVILVDEYENYAEYQQRIINTRLKHSRREDGVTYRLFMRNGGLVTRETLAPGQAIEETHDYRRHSLDEGLDFNEFARHAMKVANRHLEEDPWFRANGYVRVEDLFEDFSAEDEARFLVEEGYRREELAAWVKKHFPADGAVLLDWMKTEPNPLRRAVAVVLRNQGKSAVEIVSIFREGGDKAQQHYHNYHRGALHWLCRLYHVEKKYAGLNAVLGLAGNNIRVFLDYCHAIVADWMAADCPPLPIPWRLQDGAIHRQALILRENLYSAARSTTEINQLLERLGRLFEAAHKGPRQSEPEINHFTLRGEVADGEGRVRLERWLTDAWYEGVLRQLRGNKQKSLHELRGEDWQICPWFAPLFNLSTRRKKKMSLSGEEVLVLFRGSDTQWRRLLKQKENEFERLGGEVAVGQSQLFDDE